MTAGTSARTLLGAIVEDLPAIRRKWLEHGLASGPSDRATAEAAVAQMYRSCGLRLPRFEWVPSPPAAVELAKTLALSGPIALGGDGVESASASIAGLLSASRRRMNAAIERRYWSHDRAHDLVRQAIWDPLRTSLIDGVATAVKSLLPPVTMGVPWYGQQEAHRVAFFDVYRSSGCVSMWTQDHELLDASAALIVSTGWWWAFDDVCIMSERPTVLHTEPMPGSPQGERRLHRDDGPALEFADGSAAFVLGGAIVPEWVVRDPSVDRIAAERNVEVRRCAIERIGWDTYIEASGLDLIDATDDPGNAGCSLELYTTPDAWGRRSRILLVTNGSEERDGRRRRYGLYVPYWLSTAMNAAGWTYGIDGDDYARLLRRT